ncbi:MAG TPA: allantoinase AllB [Thermoanaerobaculia bacterium]|nr:allantoinase AllB [Thermoanaerobaculia bacterium]
MATEIVLRSTRVVTPGGLRPAAIFVRDGRIERVADPETAPPAAIDYGDLVVMPGLVDTHVHVNEPGRTEWEGFETATRAAAAGGVTTIVDMPLNSIPPTTSLAALEEKVAAMEGKIFVDVGLWGGAVPGNARELPAMVATGALGCKGFLIDSGVPEFPHLGAEDLEAAARVLAMTGAPLLLHAELAGPIESARRRAAALPRTSYRRWLASRPPEAEDDAIELAAEVCGRSGARVHVVHLSSATALGTITRARERGTALTAETAPHYLHFAAEEIPDRATELKCAPPIREAENREHLWSGLASGSIDLVVTDHSPSTPALKCCESGDFEAAWGGIASLQLGLAATWSGARSRGFSIEAIARWMCEAPARLAGISLRKGRIAPGLDADFAVVDPEAKFRVDPLRLEHRHKITPYAGAELHGVVRATWLRGRRLFDGRAVEGRAGGGWVRG